MKSSLRIILFPSFFIYRNPNILSQRKLKTRSIITFVPPTTYFDTIANCFSRFENPNPPRFCSIALKVENISSFCWTPLDRGTLLFIFFHQLSSHIFFFCESIRCICIYIYTWRVCTIRIHHTHAHKFSAVPGDWWCAFFFAYYLPFPVSAQLTFYYFSNIREWLLPVRRHHHHRLLLGLPTAASTPAAAAYSETETETAAALPQQTTTTTTTSSCLVVVAVVAVVVVVVSLW
jgi:hypothetical protein